MLKYKLSNEEFEALSEAEKGFYKVDGETAFLQVDGAVDKSKLDEFRSNNVELLKQVDQFKGVDLEKYKQLTAREQEMRDKKLIEEGDVDTLLKEKTAAIQSDYEAKLANLQKEVGSLSETNQSIVSKYEIDGAAMKAFSAHKISPDAHDALMSQIRSKFVIDGGNVLAKDGDKIVTGANGNLTIDEFVASQPEVFKVPSSGGRGTGAGGQPPASGEKTASEKISSGISKAFG